MGSTFEFMHNFTRIHEWFLDGTRDYGKWVHAWSGSMLSVGQFSGGMVCLVTPDEVRHVLKDNFDNYEKGELVHDVLREFFGDGIFSTDGPRWKVHRKVCVILFRFFFFFCESCVWVASLGTMLSGARDRPIGLATISRWLCICSPRS